MILLVDNYDSFTFNLRDYIAQTGAKVEVVRSDDPALLHVDLAVYDGMVLSPGPGRPDDAGYCMDLIARAEDVLPVLGVCLGMQAIGQHFGGTVVKAAYPMHGKTSEIERVDHPLFDGIQAHLEVCRYHSLVVTGLENSPLKVIAWSALNEVMAVAHSDKPIWGVQFHPEAILTQAGHQMIDNWIKSINLQ